MKASRVWIAVGLIALGLQLTGQLYCVLTDILVPVVLIAMLAALLWLPPLVWCFARDATHQGPPTRTVRYLSVTVNTGRVISDHLHQMLPHGEPEGFTTRRRNWTDMFRETRDAVAVVWRQGKDGPHA